MVITSNNSFRMILKLHVQIINCQFRKVSIIVVSLKHKVFWPGVSWYNCTTPTQQYCTALFFAVLICTLQCVYSDINITWSKSYKLKTTIILPVWLIYLPKISIYSHVFIHSIRQQRIYLMLISTDSRYKVISILSTGIPVSIK